MSHIVERLGKSTVFLQNFFNMVDTTTTFIEKKPINLKINILVVV